MSIKYTVLACLVLIAGSCGRKAEQSGPAGPTGGIPAEKSWKDQARAARQRGAAFLLKGANEGKWSFMPDQPPSLGITGLAALGILRSSSGQSSPEMDVTLDWIAAQQHPDGSLHTGQLATYCTSISILALKESGRRKYEPVISRALEYLRQVQLDGGEGYQESSEYYGGIGYEKKKDDPTRPNPNLSTTAWALEAAEAAGLAKDDDFYSKALIFLQRSQNRSESNDQVVDAGGARIAPGNDGGAYYQPWASRAGIERRPGGGQSFRSYGSMSYALLKSYLFCDLEGKDPRVKAVMAWIQGNWKVDTNPGMEHLEEEGAPYKGLYYYWVTLGRTLGAAERRGTSFAGTPMADWRREVARALISQQQADGSWINAKNSGWWEASPLLVTGYALLVLSDCLQDE